MVGYSNDKVTRRIDGEKRHRFLATHRLIGLRKKKQLFVVSNSIELYFATVVMYGLYAIAVVTLANQRIRCSSIFCNYHFRFLNSFRFAIASNELSDTRASTRSIGRFVDTQSNRSTSST